MRGLIGLLAVLLVAGCQGVALPPLPEAQRASEIIELRSGRSLSTAELVERLAQAPRVIVGEQHDNADHHVLQLWLMRALASQRPQGSLLLEMLVAQQQSRVDTVRQQLKSQGWPEDLPAALAWQPGWDWALYGPIVRFALAQPYPLLAANLDASEIRRIYAQPPVLSGVHANSQAVKDLLQTQIRDAHCGLLPESQVPAMLAVQQQRDRRMAERLLAAPVPALFFTGAYHARKDVGVPVHLADLGAAQGTAVLILAQQGTPVAADSADYVWYSARMPDQDDCAPLRK
ncbi:ChaN family lipoprotein [Pseudomonas sp. MF4836]|uniref:ChaN family lipoprotein n=1 Tax=Pseudomonas sp. MF4836 TaxID=1960827 RepID=UPI000995E925|nr:ChaN family lipoprotein [Pseudomonas sp. MF4836]OOV94221.1 iron(III) ABC transporter [Pseudomonas sp. MF4836]